MAIDEVAKPAIYIDVNGEKYCCDFSVDLTGDLEAQGCTRITEAYNRG